MIWFNFLSIKSVIEKHFSFEIFASVIEKNKNIFVQRFLLTIQAFGRRQVWRKWRSGSRCCDKSCVTRPCPSRPRLFHARLPCLSCLRRVSSLSSSFFWWRSGWTFSSLPPSFRAAVGNPSSSKRVEPRAKMESHTREVRCQLKVLFWNGIILIPI